MKTSDLKPVSQLAKQYGAKCLIYGPPGSGKTPMIMTAPRPVLLVTEPGLLSMRGSNIPAWEGYTPDKIEEFFKWCGQSSETKNFDTICIDSGSQLAEIELLKWLGKCKDGRKAYGELSRSVMEYVDQLYFMPEKNIVIIAKETKHEELTWSMTGPMPISTTVMKKVPYFPGQDLNIKIPHRYDEILRAAKGIIPGFPGEHRFLKTSGSDSELLVRDRSGKLSEYEPQDLTALFTKITTA